MPSAVITLKDLPLVCRCRVLVDILAAVTGGERENSLVNVEKIIEFTQTVQSEESQLKSLKNVLGTQVYLCFEQN